MKPEPRIPYLSLRIRSLSSTNDGGRTTNAWLFVLRPSSFVRLHERFGHDYDCSSPGSKLSDEPVGRQPSTCLAWPVSRQRREFSEIASKMSNIRLIGAARHLSIIC